MRLLVAALCALLLVGIPALASGAERPQPTPTSPNIVIFYLDDVAPHDGRLWSDPAITPALYDLFVAHGITFANSIGETSLCCPGRVGLLTGLHTQNHGVTENNVQLFHPQESIALELKKTGYDTVLIGKYLNLPETLTAAQWKEHAAAWTELDAYRTKWVAKTWEQFTLYTKEGNVEYDENRTQMVADRAVMRLRQAPSDEPVFMDLSIMDLHGPNNPMAQFVGDPRCADMPPWDPPNYNEADVSDKPPDIQSLPLLPYADGWPMVTYCEEMLGVDLLVQQVEDELAAEGRLDNTLFIFSADNGMGWGQHRLGQVKHQPYSTPVPLIMNWSARWGDTPRTIDEYVSNIDIAPTLCAITGCTLGPYPTGQQHPDGVSLLPLLDGTTDRLARDAVLERNWYGGVWSGIRTSFHNPLGQWHYVEYADGFRELYDSVADPYELNNLAGNAAYGPLMDDLAAQLEELRQEGVVTRPDAGIARTPTGPFAGDGIYDSLPSAAQRQTVTGALRRTSYDFWVAIDNDASVSRAFVLHDKVSGNGRMRIRYFANGVDVTSEVVAGSYSTGPLAPGASASLMIEVHVAKRARLGTRKRADLFVAAADAPGLVDTVRAVVVR